MISSLDVSCTIQPHLLFGLPRQLGDPCAYCSLFVVVFSADTLIIRSNSNESHLVARTVKFSTTQETPSTDPIGHLEPTKAFYKLLSLRARIKIPKSSSPAPEWPNYKAMMSLHQGLWSHPRLGVNTMKIKVQATKV